MKNLVIKPIGKVSVEDIDIVYSYGIYEENGVEKFDLITKVYGDANGEYALGEATIYRCDLEKVLNVMGKNREDLEEMLADTCQKNLSMDENDNIDQISEELTVAVSEIEDKTFISIGMSAMDKIDSKYLTVFVNGYDFSSDFSKFKASGNHASKEVVNVFMNNPIEMKDAKSFKSELLNILGDSEDLDK